MQFSNVLIFTADKDTASTAYNIKGRQYDFNNATVTISEFVGEFPMSVILSYRCYSLPKNNMNVIKAKPAGIDNVIELREVSAHPRNLEKKVL